jgi:hypothetical protein
MDGRASLSVCAHRPHDIFIRLMILRTNSQKPSEELLKKFRATFPHLAYASHSGSHSDAQGLPFSNSLDITHIARYVHRAISRALLPGCDTMDEREEPPDFAFRARTLILPRNESASVKSSAY